MPSEISNSSSRIIVSNYSSGIFSTYPGGGSPKTPLVRFTFSFTPKVGVTNNSFHYLQIKTFKYCLVPLGPDGYGDVPNSDSWTSLSKEQIMYLIVPQKTGDTPILAITWGDINSIRDNNRRYLRCQQNPSETASAQPTVNYLSLNVKKMDEFLGIKDSQLHVKMSFEEISISGNDMTPIYSEDTVFNGDGDSEIYLKTMHGEKDIGLRTENPSVGALVDSKEYVNSSSFSVDITGYSGYAALYSYKINDKPLSDWYDIQSTKNNMENSNSASMSKANLIINLGAEAPDGKYKIIIFVRDEWWNITPIDDAIHFEIIKASEAPFECELNVYGQNGNSRYAGIEISPSGEFFPNRMVNVVFFGNSELPLKCRIYSANHDVLIPKITSEVVTNSSGQNATDELIITQEPINEYLKSLESLQVSNSSSGSIYLSDCDSTEFLYKNDFGQSKSRKINTIECYLVGSDYNTSSDRSITIEFIDYAGNMWSDTKTIKLNNRIFTCKSRNLREQSSDYSHIVEKENTYGAYDTIPETASGGDDAYKRTWDDIYFPDKQAPKMKGKDIDIDWCRSAYKQYVNAGNKFSYIDSDSYGIIEMEEDSEKEYQPVLDENGRTTSIWNTNKKYSPYVSRNASDIWFRVIDNTGYGDIKLEFERFDMMSTPGDMVNPTAGGYKGDVVMIYNADDPRCLAAEQNADGTISYPVEKMNTLYMNLLAVYSGKPGSIYDWFSGESVISNETTGAFDATFNCSRICIIVCTDSSREASGFKIKAGQKIGLTYSNYDIDEKNGELWYHGESDNWGSTDKKIRMYYDYYDSNVSFDYDRGFVIINSNDLPDDAAVTCDYSYYKHISDYDEEEKLWLNGGSEENDSIEHSRLYVSSEDDFYDYMIPSIYVTPYLENIKKDGSLYTPENKVAGKFTDSFWSIDKDRGVVEINKHSDENPSGNVPFNSNGYPMRMTMDYTHHTFYRLSNDGYGNVHFEDKVIVADSTPVYPDATWADIRIINEGDAILENGKLVFKCRGETEGDTEEVKKPLDVNRPWDVQEGKKAVTWDRCRVYLSYTYDDSYFQFTPTISDLRRTYNKAGGNEAMLKKSDSEKYLAPKEALFGRIVWNLAGDTGSQLDNPQYPSDGLVVGRKSWSAEVSGKFYVIEE